MTVEKPITKLLVLDPTVVPEAAEASMAPRLDTLDGKVLGLLDNRKFNSNKVLDLVAEQLAEKYKLAGVMRRRKPNASKGVPDEMLNELVEGCQAVIVGVGD